jgi:hypothetical protein
MGYFQKSGRLCIKEANPERKVRILEKDLDILTSSIFGG